MSGYGFPPAWLAGTPLQLPLRYFSRQVPPGRILYQRQNSILYHYANQLFGWGELPPPPLVSWLEQGASPGPFWLLAPPEWQPALAAWLAGSRLTLAAGEQQLLALRTSPPEPVLLPPGFHCAPLREYDNTIGELYTLFERELQLPASGLEPRQQLASVNEHGEAWGLYHERELAGKLDLLYPVDDQVWAGGLFIRPPWRGNKLGRRFLLHLLQQSRFQRLEMQISPQLLTYYQALGCQPLCEFIWYYLNPVKVV